MPRPDTFPADFLPAANCNPASTPGQTGWLKYAAPLLLLCLVLGLLYRDGLAWLLEVWSHNDYSHGYLVPLVSLYLVWEQREHLRMLPVTPAYPAAITVILVSLVLLFISRGSAFIQLETASLFLIIPGILLLLFGRQITRAALLPWLYLSFMLPWFDLFLNRLQPPFQRLTAILGTGLLSLIYPVFLSNTFIQLPSITLEVAKECSGVAFFISVLAIGIPLVYLTQRSWNRAALVLSIGIIITILANGFRVAMAGIMGENYGPELLHGPAHILQGWFVAWIGWAGLFLVNWLVAKQADATSPRLFERWKSPLTPNEQHQKMARISPGQIYLASFILILCTAVIYFTSPRPVSLAAPLTDLPLKQANWTGINAEWLDQESLFPGADEQLSRSYRSPRSTEPVYLHIAYFKKQTEQQRMVNRFSRPLHKKATEIVLPSFAPGIIPHKVNRTTLLQGGTLYDIFFWYQFPAREAITDRNNARLTGLKNAIIRRQNNGAVVLIATQHHPKPDTTNDIPEPLITFLRDFGSTISGLLP